MLPSAMSRVTIILICLILGSIVTNHVQVAVHAAPINAHLFLTPAIYVARDPHETIDIAVNISEVTNLHCCEFTVNFNRSLLEVHDVTQGAFFPPLATFNVTIDDFEGTVTIYICMVDPDASLGGEGILANVEFNVTQPALRDPSPSVLQLARTHLLTADSQAISHSVVSALVFWESLQPVPLGGGEEIDLFTQQGGEGPNEPGGIYLRDQVVTLTSHVTYEDWPAQQVLVSFQILSPTNETAGIFINETDENGFASVSFRIPDLQTSYGTWTVISSVDIACNIFWDTLEFSVRPPIVGGHSISIEPRPPRTPSILYLIFIGILASCLPFTRRRALRLRWRL